MITICKIDKWHASSFLWRANYFKFICSKQNNDEEKHDFTTGFSMPFKDSLERAYRLPDSLLWESSLWQHDHRQRWEKSWTKDWQQDLRRTPVGCSLSLSFFENALRERWGIMIITPEESSLGYTDSADSLTFVLPEIMFLTFFSF